MNAGSLRALNYRNFRLLWLGQFISVSGSMMQSAAILWHVSLLVPEQHQGLALGAVGLVRLVPVVLFSLLGGVVADALDRRKLMLIAQTGMLLSALVLAVFTLQGWATLGLVYLLAALSSVAGAFDTPARQSLIPNLVSPPDVPSAISLNTIMFQTAGVVGPALGGLIIAMPGNAAPATGVGWVYTLNAFSFLAVIAALLLMRDMPPVINRDKNAVSLRAALEGLRYVFAAPLIRSTMLLDFFVTFFASATTLLPIFAQSILRVGPAGYGWLAAAPAVGAMLASLAMVRLSVRIERRGLVLLWAVFVYGLTTVIFGLAPTFWIMFLCLALTGAADTVSTVLRNIIRQLSTPDHLRGRMVSVNMVFFMGGPQLGEMEAGVVANWLGAPFSVISGGIGCLLVTLWIGATTPALRAYRRETEIGIQAAAV